MTSINKLLNKALSKKSPTNPHSSPKSKNNGFVKIIKNESPVMKVEHKSGHKGDNKADQKDIQKIKIYDIKNKEINPTSGNNTLKYDSTIKLGQKVNRKIIPNFKKIHCYMSWTPFVEPCNLYEPLILDTFSEYYYPKMTEIEDKYLLAAITEGVKIKKIGYKKKSK